MINFRLSTTNGLQYIQNLFNQAIHVFRSSTKSRRQHHHVQQPHAPQTFISENLGTCIQYTSLIIAFSSVALTWNWDLILIATECGQGWRLDRGDQEARTSYKPIDFT